MSTKFSELNDYEQEKLFDEFLDECYPDVEILGDKYPLSTVLKEADPIKYRCAFGDWASEQEDEEETEEDE